MEGEQREISTWLWGVEGCYKGEGEGRVLTGVAEGRDICAGVREVEL